MTDIHSHILPGVDDGAATPEESARMLRLAIQGGTRAIVATPHANLRYSFDPVRCRELAAQLGEEHSAGPRVYPGCEVHLTPENFARVLKHPQLFTLNSGDCILLELPGRLLPPVVSSTVQSLAGAGLRVIIAHPERHPFLQHHLSYTSQLADRGCYFQITARSLNGGFGPAAMSTAHYLLKRRLAHFIASDAHGATYRKPGLSDSFQRVSSMYGQPAARRLLDENPEAALHGSEIRSMPETPGWLASLFSRTSNGLTKKSAA